MGSTRQNASRYADEGCSSIIDHPNSDDLCGAKVMMVEHPENCIGCSACARRCPKKNIMCEPKVRVR